MDMDDEQPKAMRQATCIEVLVFLIWYALVMVTLARLECCA